MAHILLVDDDEPFRVLLRRTLNHFGHTVDEAANGEQACKVFHEVGADLIIMDLIMPEKEGLETIRLLRKKGSTVKIVAMSGGGRVEPRDVLQTALLLGANAILPKPFSQAELQVVLKKWLPDERLQEAESPPQSAG